MANTSATWQYAAHTTDKLILQLLSKSHTKKKTKKACLLKKNIEELFGEKIVRVGNEQKKGKVETATGLGRGRRRRRREEIVKWNQMTPLRFQTVRRHQTSEKGKGGNSNRTQQRQKKKKRGDSKAESNDIPEIPDMGEASDIPSLPLGTRPANKSTVPDHLKMKHSTEPGSSEDQTWDSCCMKLTNVTVNPPCPFCHLSSSANVWPIQ